MSSSRVNVVFLFWSLFPVFPVHKPSLVYFILNAILLAATSCTPPVDQQIYFLFIFVLLYSPRRQTNLFYPPFPDLFFMRFYRFFFG